MSVGQYASPQVAYILRSFSPQSCLKVAYLFSRKEEVPLQPKSNICIFRWKECDFYYVLLKITPFRHLLLRMFGYGGSKTSAIIHLEFTLH